MVPARFLVNISGSIRAYSVEILHIHSKLKLPKCFNFSVFKVYIAGSMADGSKAKSVEFCCYDILGSQQNSLKYQIVNWATSGFF